MSLATPLRSSVCLVIALAASPLACNGDSGSSGSPGGACATLKSAFAQCPLSGLTGGGVFLTEAACVEDLSLPGSPSAAAYEACASAITQTACASGTAIAECDVRGTLAGGAVCNVGLQCASGMCTVPAGATCGTCAAVVADGQACLGAGGCAQGSACVGGLCTALTYGGAGVSCDGVTALCQSDLYCAAASTAGGVPTCSALPTSGQACGQDTHFGAVCAPPYVCGTSGTCGMGGGVGAACPCAPGLSCAGPADGGTTLTCESQTAQAPGAPCSQLEPCETGACDLATATCPTVLTDGQACVAGSASAVCDDVSTCSSGVCVSVATTVAVCK